MDSIRVAIVAPSMSILGGQAVQAQRLLDGWASDPEVAAWLVPHNPELPAPFDALLRVKYVRTIATQLWYWPSLFRELRRADVAHVFSASYWSFLLAPLPAALVARLLGTPVVLNYRSGEAPDHLRRSAVARWALRRVALNVVPSAFLQEVFASFGIPSQVVPNTIDVQRFSYRSRDPLRPRLLSTRNFEPLYNVACTLRAFARVQARFPDATLTLVGAGSQDTMLRELAADLKLRNVTFTGPIAPQEIASFYAAADIYVQTPSIDNMPGSIVEAFASGLPVVATGVGGVPVILTHGEHGLLAPDDDDETIAGHVMTLLEQPEYARRLAAAAHATCRAYAWPVVRGQWLAAYRAVLRSKTARPAPATVVAAPVPDAHAAPPPRTPPIQDRVPIAVVLSSFDAGGTERQMSELITRLDRRRFAVHAVCFRRNGMWLPGVERSGAPITEFPLRSLHTPATARLMAAFARWCEDHRIAVVHACDLYANIFALPAAALARVPVRIGSRRGIVNPTNTRGLLALQRLSYAFAHRLVANSDAAARRLRAEWIAASKIRVIANGIDLALFEPRAGRARGRVLTTVANLRPGKGHDVLLRAAALAARRIPDLRLNLIGDGPLRPKLERLAAELGVSDRVAFLGHVSDVPSWLAESDVFALPSFMEASPNSVIEAMAAGLPVVATNVGGIPEIVEHGRNGLLVPPGDAQALADTLVRLLDSADESARLAAAGRQTIVASYSFDRMVGEFEALYLGELRSRRAFEPVSVERQTAA